MAVSEPGDPLVMSGGRLTSCADAIILISSRPNKPQSTDEWCAMLPKYSPREIVQTIAFLRRAGVNIDRVLKGGTAK